MKKLFVVILTTLILAGAGCSSVNKVSADRSVEIQTKNGFSGFGKDVEKFSVDELFSTASDDAGFRIYFPKYIPEGLIIDRKFIWNKNSVNVALVKSLDATNSEVIIQQNLKETRPNTITKRLEKLTAREEVKLANNLVGYFGYYEPSPGVKFNTIILASPYLDIGVWSKTYNKDNLIKIVNSLVTVK